MKSKTVSVRFLKSHRPSPREEEEEDLGPPIPPHLRPESRRDCINGIRPCPFVGCEYNLYLDVTPNGSIKFNFPDIEPDQMSESCAIDVADRGESTLVSVGKFMNLTRERTRQIQTIAEAKLVDGGILDLKPEGVEISRGIEPEDL